MSYRAAIKYRNLVGTQLLKDNKNITHHIQERLKMNNCKRDEKQILDPLPSSLDLIQNHISCILPCPWLFSFINALYRIT